VFKIFPTVFLLVPIFMTFYSVHGVILFSSAQRLNWILQAANAKWCSNQEKYTNANTLQGNHRHQSSVLSCLLVSHFKYICDHVKFVLTARESLSILPIPAPQSLPTMAIMWTHNITRKTRSTQQLHCREMDWATATCTANLAKPGHVVFELWEWRDICKG